MNLYLKKLLMLLCFGILMPMGQISAVWEQPPHQFLALGGAMDMASDADGNAIVLLDNGGAVEAFYYTRTTNLWTGPTVLGTTNQFLSLDMHASGTAIAVWVDTDGLSLRSAFFDGSAWTPGSPDPFAVGTDTFIRGMKVVMNGPDTALVTWFDRFAEIYNSNFFSAGTWGATIQIDTPPSFTPASVDYSSNGTAVTTFTAPFDPLLVSNYIGGVWLPAVTLDPLLPFASHNAVSAIDAFGRAVVIWVNTAGDVKSSTFDGAWLPAVTISNTAGNSPFSTSLSMAPGGTAVAAWVDGAGVGFSNSYNGTTWGVPQQFANPADSSKTDISVNASGDALLLFQRPGGSGDGAIFSTRLPLGGVWTSPEFLFAPTNSVPYLIASLSDNGFGFAAWPMGGEGFEYFAAVEIVALPPTSINATTCTNKFATQTDRVNIITWTPSPSTNIVSYEVRRNGVLVAVIPASNPLVYADHNRCKNITDVYSVTAVDANDLVSLPVTVTVR